MVVSRQCLVGLAIYCTVLPSFALGKGDFTLPPISRLQSVETLARSIAKISFLAEQRLLLVPAQRGDFFIELSYDLSKESRVQRFGNFTTRIQQLRIQSPYGARASSQIPYFLNDHLFVFASKELEVARFDGDFDLLAKRSLVYDGIRPAADRGGEATKRETDRLRRRFLKAIEASGEAVIRDLVHLGRRQRVQEFLLLAGLKHFPLLTMHCALKIPTRCTIKRRCNLEGADFNGMALFKAKDGVRLMLAEQKRGLVHMLRYHSCRHITPLASYRVPKTVGVSDIFVDHQKNLWLSSLSADPYTNASLMYWSASEWLTLPRTSSSTAEQKGPTLFD